MPDGKYKPSMSGIKLKFKLPGMESKDKSEKPDGGDEEEGEEKAGDRGASLMRAIKSGADGETIEQLICDIVNRKSE